MTPKRAAAFAWAFAVAFALAYLVAVWKNYALFTYHPAIRQFGFGTQKPVDGPAMYWYGWIATAAIAGTVAGLTACRLPEKLAQRLKSDWAWVVPLCVIAVFCFLLRGYFLR